MKKLALTSLLAVFAVSGAHAANVIDGNPLYMPKAGHFYSVSSLESHTEPGRAWTLGEEFGYGVTDKLGVELNTSLSEHAAFDDYHWDGLRLGVAYRALNDGAWKMDLIGAYEVEGGLYNHPVPAGEDAWFDKDVTEYTWTAGLRGGYVASNWTIAGHALFSYWNTETFKWNADAGEQGIHALLLGLDAQYVFCPHFSMVLGAEYTGFIDNNWRGVEGNEVKNAGKWSAELGANYNIDATKYVGLYINAKWNHQGGDAHDTWQKETGYGIGAKFGIDF